MNIFRFIAHLKILFKRDRIIVILIALLLNLLLGLLFYFTEKNVQDISITDAIWWAMVTMTTVGYGDFYAQTWIGRFFISYPCMLLGIGIIGYLVGVIANAIIDFAFKSRRGLMDIEFKSHIIICNFPGEKKVLNIVKELRAAPEYSRKKFVLVAERPEELSENLKNENIHFVYGSPTDENILLKANILHCGGVIILAENPTESRSDERTFVVGSLIEMMEKEHNISIKTITEIIASDNIRNMVRADVDGYISEDGMAGRLLVQEFINPGINRIISQIISNSIGSQLYIHDTILINYKIRDVQIAALEHDINLQVIGLVRGKENILNPSKNIKILKNDKLIVLAEKADDLKSIESALLKKRQRDLQ